MASLLQFFTHGAGRVVGTGARKTWGLATGGPIGRMALGGTIGGTAGYLGSDYNSPTMQFGAVAKGAIFGAAAGGASWAMPRMARGAWRLNMMAGRNILRRTEAAADRAFIGPRLPGGFTSPIKEGASSSIRARRIKEFASSPVGLAGKGLWGAGKKAAGPAGRGLKGAAWFALEHPVMTLGAGAAAFGGWSYLQSDTPSPTMTGATMNVNYNQQAIAAQELQMGMISPSGMVGTAPQMMGRMHRAMMQSTYGLTQGLHRGRHG